MINIQNMDYKQLMDMISDRNIFSGEVSEAEIISFELDFGIELPQVYRKFILSFGSLFSQTNFNLFGLGCVKVLSPSLYWATKWLKLNSPGVPSNLLPVSQVSSNEFACVLISDQQQDPQVISWDLRFDAEKQKRAVLSPSLSAYYKYVAFELLVIDHALQRISVLVEQSDKVHHYDHTGKGKLPRNHEMRLHRFCSRDIVLGILALRHITGINCLEVDVFLPIDVEPFEPGGSLLFMTLFILADAYRCGGSMEIRFTENVDGGQVPRKIVALAQKVGAEIKQESLNKRILDPDDSQRLFIALTDFSPETLQLFNNRKSPALKSCYVIARGIWTKAEVEYLLRSYEDASRLFSGGADIFEELLLRRDQKFAESAILMGNLNRALSRPNQLEKLISNEAIDLEDNTRIVKTGFAEDPHIVFYSVSPGRDEKSLAFSIPWKDMFDDESGDVNFDTEFAVLIRCRNSPDILQNFDKDLNYASEVSLQRNIQTFLLFPRDFYDSIIDPYRDEWQKRTRGKNITILVAEDSTYLIEEEAFRRLELSRVVRES